MIEFTPDGPFSEKANQLFPGRVRVLGLGQTGAAEEVPARGRRSGEREASEEEVPS